MNGSNGKHSSLYEQTLEYARREIDEASTQITRLRERLSCLEARMEAAKAVYESVAARLNVEDEIGEAAPAEEPESRPASNPPLISREEISRLLQSQEPPPREMPPPAPVPARESGGLSTAEMDLIRRHLEARNTPPRAAAPEPVPAAPAAPPRRGTPGGLSEDDRKLIEEHLRRRMDAERQSA